MDASPSTTVPGDYRQTEAQLANFHLNKAIAQLQAQRIEIDTLTLDNIRLHSQLEDLERMTEPRRPAESQPDDHQRYVPETEFQDMRGQRDHAIHSYHRELRRRNEIEKMVVDELCGTCLHTAAKNEKLQRRLESEQLERYAAMEDRDKAQAEAAKARAQMVLMRMQLEGLQRE